MSRMIYVGVLDQWIQDRDHDVWGTLYNDFVHGEKICVKRVTKIDNTLQILETRDNTFYTLKDEK